MQRRRDDKDFGDQFEDFGSFGSQRTMMPSIFGGKDPFDDPFFTRPMGSMFGSSLFSSSSSLGRSYSHASNNEKPKGIVIEELDSDEDERGDGSDSQKKSTIDLKEVPTIEHPSDEDSDEPKSKHTNHSSCQRKVERTQPQSRSFSTQSFRVTYGGVDGAYYTSTTTRRTGDSGVVVEESQEADKTTGQASHRISRGINDKGHTLLRKISSDGKVDTLQTLHNLNEDELAGFEETWKGNQIGSLPGFSDGFNRHVNAGHSSMQQKANALLGSSNMEKSRKAGEMGQDNETKNKKIVRINIE